MLTDQEKKQFEGDSSPVDTPSGGSEENFHTPKFVLSDEEPEEDFTMDVPVYLSDEQKQPETAQALESGSPENTAEAFSEPEVTTKDALEVNQPISSGKAESVEEAPPKKGFFAALAGLRLRFGKKKAPANPGDSTAKLPKGKKKKKQADSVHPPGEDEKALIDPTQEGAGATLTKSPSALPRLIKGGKKNEDESSKSVKKKSKRPGKIAKAYKKGNHPEKKKSSKRLIIIIIAAILSLAAAIVVFLFFLRGSSKDSLEKAHTLAAEGDFESARALYATLLEDETFAADAYLGVAEALVAMEDIEGAVAELETGLEATGDPRLEERMSELLPLKDSAESKEVAPVYSTDPIVWKDSALEKMVRIAINKPAGTISEHDLKDIATLKILGADHVTTLPDGLNSINTMRGYSLDGIEYTERGEIVSLADLAHFKNLRRLTVGYNRVGDLSGLESLSKLELLSLYVNEVEDISPLSALTSLKNLYCYGNKIENISALQSLINLRVLSVQHNQIVDLSPIAALTDMRVLYISDNQIADISAVAGMSNLIFLNAQTNQIKDISVLAGLTKLTDINFQGNPVRDFSSVGHVQNKESSFS